MPSSLPPRRALVVEDDPLYVVLLQSLLEDMGFAVDAVGRLTDACWYIGRKYELVTLDLQLPDATGTQSLKAVRPAFPDAVVMVISGYMDERLTLELLHLGADHCAQKPNQPADFRRAVELTLAMKNPARVLDEIETRVAEAQTISANPSPG